MEVESYSPHMPSIGLLFETTKFGTQVLSNLGLQLSLGESISERMKQILTSQFVNAAEKVGVSCGVQDASDSMSTEGQVLLNAFGRLDLIEVLYNRIPEEVGALDIRYRAKGHEGLGKGLEVDFFIKNKELEEWVGPVFISASWLRSAQNKPQGNTLKLVTMDERDLKGESQEMAPHLAKSRYCITESTSEVKRKSGTSQPAQPLHPAQDRIFRISDTKEWRQILSVKNYNHGFENLRFNVEAEVPRWTSEYDQILHDIALIGGSHMNTSCTLIGSNGSSIDAKKTISSKVDSNTTIATITNSTAIANNGSKDPGSCLSASKKPESSQEFASDASQGRHIARVSGIDWGTANLAELCNLFTNYGNIEVAVVYPFLGDIFLCYVSPVAVSNAIAHLNDLLLGCGRLRISSATKSEAIHLMSQYEHAFYCPSKRFSLKAQELPKVVNPLSRTLHVSFDFVGEKKVLSDPVIFLTLSKHCQPIRIKREVKKSYKNLWFVEYASESDALKVLMKQHNQPLESGTLRISFTKTL